MRGLVASCSHELQIPDPPRGCRVSLKQSHLPSQSQPSCHLSHAARPLPPQSGRSPTLLEAAWALAMNPLAQGRIPYLLCALDLSAALTQDTLSSLHVRPQRLPVSPRFSSLLLRSSGLFLCLHQPAADSFTPCSVHTATLVASVKSHNYQITVCGSKEL